jgi:sugar (pentulose or hexulose) kinase
MLAEKRYLALDFGAESGRGILGVLSDGKLVLSEVHRFLTGPVELPTKYATTDQDCDSECSLVWDFVRFWEEAKLSITNAAKIGSLRSIGVDTWGVDFAVLDKNGGLVEYPYHYRDSRTDGMLEKAFSLMPKEKLYEITGIQFMKLNTLFQLLSMVVNDSPALKIADKLIMVPDLINYWLTGRAVSEYTDATTSQIFDARNGVWSEEIISAMGFPKHIFPEIVAPGTLLGGLRPALAKELGCDAKVVVPATHDTGSAVAAVPAEEQDFVWISSGTWSIIGTNTPAPIINTDSYTSNFTNEGGINKTNRFSKNVTGLWIVQQCRNDWRKMGKDYSYTELTQLAQTAPHLESFIDPDYSEFLEMGDMVEKVRNYCRLTGQPIPEDVGEVIRAALQGLALRYRFVIEELERISGKQARVIHIVGGGTKNTLLNQFTADATGKQVVTGPVEATAVGNIITQALALGDIVDYQMGVEVIKNSFEIKAYMPGDRTSWDKAFEQFKANLNKIELAF